MNPLYPIAAFVFLGHQGNHKVPSAPISIEALEERPEISGCGIEFSLADTNLKEPPLVFWWGFGPEGALVRISGREHRLEQVSERESGKGAKRVITEVWSDSEVRIKLVYRVVASQWESSTLRGTLTLTIHGYSKTYRVNGSKGC